jgi:hypothetical protein
VVPETTWRWLVQSKGSRLEARKAARILLLPRSAVTWIILSARIAMPKKLMDMDAGLRGDAELISVSL